METAGKAFGKENLVKDKKKNMSSIEKEIPVFFVHTGRQWYLKKTVHLAELYNDRVYLLGDKRNKTYCKNWIDQEGIDQSRFKRFESMYQHMSTNPYQFELNCFKRFYLIYEYMLRNNEASCILLDSDLCTFVKYGDMDFAKGRYLAAYSMSKNQEPYVWAGSPHVSFWTKAGLEKFLDLIERYYTTDIDVLRKKYEYHKQKGLDGGICDMTLLYLFKKENPLEIFNTAIRKENTVFDHFLISGTNYLRNEYLFDEKLKIKLIHWVKNEPYFFDAETKELVRALTLHAQGTSKAYIWAIDKKRDSRTHYLFCRFYIQMRKRIRNILRK